MTKIKSVLIFENGNIAVFDDKGQQVPSLQNSWVNFNALRKLAKAIAKDNPEIKGSFPLSYDPLMDYVRFYRKPKPQPVSKEDK